MSLHRRRNINDEDIFKKYYYDTSIGFISEPKLYKKLKEDGYHITHDKLKQFIKQQNVNQIFRNIGKRQYLSIVAKEPKDIYQADLLDVHQYAKFNNGYKWILNVVDVYSRFAVSIPIKTKDENDLIDAFNKVFKEIGKPSNLTTDLEAGIMGRKFQNLLKKNEINHYAVNPQQKRSNAIVERFNRTLREKIRDVLYVYDTNNWLSFLNSIVYNYNNTIHRTIKATPEDVFNRKDKNNQIPTTMASIKNTFQLNDVVRVTKPNDNIFSKKSMDEKYTRGTYTVKGIKRNKIIIQNQHGDTLEKLATDLMVVGKDEVTSISDVMTAEHDLQMEKKKQKINRLLSKEGIDVKNIIQSRRGKK